MSSNRKPPRRPQTRAPRAEAGEGERLQKVLAAAGVASRRAAEQMIVDGRVSIDGRVVTELGTRVDASRARIAVDGERIGIDPHHEYILLNKPAGVITTARDPQGRPTVLDLVRSKRRLFPVGRLDADTVGLVLLTTNGELAERMTHPRYGVQRVYVAEVEGNPGPRVLRELTEGVELDDGPARAVRARVRRTSRGRSHVEVVMTEGRKHEVRKMFEQVGHPVVQLARTRFGALRLGDLGPGEWRRLTVMEVGTLLTSVGL